MLEALALLSLDNWLLRQARRFVSSSVFSEQPYSRMLVLMSKVVAGGARH